MSSQNPFAMFDSTVSELCALGDWQAAAQIRVQSGSLALNSGRSDLFEQYYAEAIALAAGHGLKYLELYTRLQRSVLLLSSVRTGRTLDIVRVEVESKDRGALVRDIRNYSRAALASCDAILALLTRPEPPEAAALFEAVKAAAGEASAFALQYPGGRLENWVQEQGSKPLTPESLNDLRAVLNDVRAEFEKRRDGLLTDAYLLLAEWKARLNDPDSQFDALDWAKQTASALPQPLSKVFLALADAYQARADREKTDDPEAASADLEQAERAAQQALAAVEALGIPMVQAAPIAKLNEIRELRKSSAPPLPLPESETFLVMADKVQKGQRALFDKRPADALPPLNAALALAAGAERRMALRLRAIAYYEMERYDDAVRDLNECISLIEQVAAGDSGALSEEVNDRLVEEESLRLMMAFAIARQKRYAEAWEADEQGRSAMFERQLARAGMQPSVEFSRVHFETLRSWLHAERAAFVSFAPTRWGTLVFLAGPDDMQPAVEVVPFRYGEMARELNDPTKEEDSKVWTEVIFNAITPLSETLLQPIERQLTRITASANVLYIEPDSYLFRVPFAALQLTGERLLGDLCPLAVMPSAAFAIWCAGRRKSSPTRKFLAVGVGGIDGIRFADQAKAVARLFPQCTSELLDQAATVDAVRQAAASCDVLHLSCHGTVSSKILDAMAASQLILADRSVTANDVLGWKLDAELVFMNVCQGGRFRMEGRTQVNGFLRAFPMAGARSIIAAVIHVDPEAAGELALEFYGEWSGGTSKARALQRAQQKLRAKYPKQPSKWASHSLVGDYS
jgi:hypothetical protein